jgi:ligand-binding sensor domain-containing protein/signal transduction histidine kinase
VFFRPYHMRAVTRSIVIIAITSAFLTGSQLPVKIYTTADGLADNRINKIVRDSRGYLWFCTQEGLSRFDGYSFTNYGPRQGLPPRAINDMLETRTGEYWLATNGGLVRFDPESADRKFSVFLPDDGEASHSINTIVEDRAGGLWCGTYGGLYRFERFKDGDSRTPAGWRFRRLEIGMPEGGVEPMRVNALLEDRRGTLWIGAESGLYRLLPNGTADRFTTGNGLPINSIHALLEDHLERLWVGTYGGLCRMTPDRTAFRRIVEHIYTAADGLANDDVMSLLESSTGKLWVGTAGGLSELLPEPLEKSRALKRYTMANGLGGPEINSIAEDRNDNLWIGSDGAMKITQSNFTTFTAADGLTPVGSAPSSVRISSIFQDRSGALYVTTGDGRKPFLSRLEGEQFKSILPNLPTRVASLGWGTHQIALQDRAGDWWIATANGLVRLAPPARFEQLAHAPVKAIYTTVDGLLNDIVLRIFEDSRGDIWVASFGNGLTRWDRRTASFQRYATDGRRDAKDGDPLLGRSISAFGEDRAGDVWIGLVGGDVVRFRNGKFAQFGETDGLGAGGVRDIYCDRAGRVWIGTSRGGVTRIDSPESDRPRFTNIGISLGLSSARAECITEDRWGRIYVCGGRGIDRLDPAAPNGAGLTKHFTTADGLASGNLEAAFADREGNLWFGTTLGLSRLAPEPDPPQSAPRILISGLRIGGVPYPLSDLGVDHLSGIQLKPDQTQFEVSFLGLSFEAGEVLRYQFMLANADRDWGPLTVQRTVNYASLKPGSYRFLVRAVNSAGIGGPAPASIAFTILPPVWQRWWFLALCACAAMSVLYAVHRARVARVVQLERVRTRIATDLHDDIGASLSQIAVVSEVLSQREGAQDQFREPLSQIANDSRELVGSMSDLVWTIDPRRDHLHDLVQRMRRFSSDMFTARNIQFRFSVPAGDLRLTVDQRRQIFLIFKEGVNNIVRHSDCTEAEVGLTLEANTLVLRVQDNGRGLDLSQAGRGNGLSGMQARAETLGGEVEIAGGRGCGTDITLRVPLGRQPLSRWRAFFHLNRW